MNFLYNFLRRNKQSQANNDALIYAAITTGIAIIHFIYGAIFFAMHVMPLMTLDLVCFVIYVILSTIIPKSTNYSLFFIFMGFEILLNSTCVTILLGWDYSFMFYILGLIPVAFVVTFSVNAFDKQLSIPIIISVSSFVCIIIARIYTFMFEPIYQIATPVFKYICSILNISLGCGVTFFFTAMFFAEVNIMQSQMEIQQQNLEDKARFDPLTKLLNRRSFEEQLNIMHKNAVINNTPYSLIMTDIDNFKHFNDTYGHDCGDYVLKTLAKIMSSQIRANDSIGRWGGEEFLLLIADEISTTKDVAERIRKNIEEYDFYYEGQSLHVTITLGVSSYYEGVKSKTLIEIADKRLYKGKESGKNRVISS